jgi:uncharacterized protein (DUF1499 family)
LLAVDVFLAVRASFQLTTGIVNNRLPPCPGKANCVSSDAADKMHRIAPYRLKTAARDAWHGLQDAVAAERRITLIEVSDSYLHVEVRSAVMRFVDDTEFELRIEDAHYRRSIGGANRQQRCWRQQKESGAHSQRFANTRAGGVGKRIKGSSF